MNTLEIPRLMVLHDQHTGDIERLRLSAGIPAPVEISSFTDNRQTNPFNSRLSETAHVADILLVQADLMFGRPSFDATKVEAATRHSVRPQRLGVFDDDYEVMWMNIVKKETI